MTPEGKLLVEGTHGTIGHVDIGLGDDLERGVHGKHRNAQIDGIDIVLGDIHGNGAAAALIYLAQLAGLPANMLGIQNTAAKPIISAVASLVPALPRAPVYLVTTTP